jgi:hypothetical protein
MKLTTLTSPTIALVAVLTIGGGTAAWLMSTPTPPGRTAPGTAFSGTRALDILERLLGDEAPHPIGSAANRRVEERIVTELEELGLEPEFQRRFVCGSYRHYCGDVRNILARIPGAAGVRGRDGSAVVLNAHYDSQAATPGAADAMSGVASVLEIARGLLDADELERDVILLLNDGEEAGLLGARAFVLHHPWAAGVVGFVNLEARGSGGPSVPAYTIGADRAVLAPYAAGFGRRAPGSAIGALSALLPAANDIAVFDSLHIPGVTLGFASNVRHYHTPLDDLAHLDAGSVQQQGDAALRIVRALATGPDPREATGRMSFVALGPVTLRWPETWAAGLSYVTALALLVLVVLLIRRGVIAGRRVAWGLLAFPLTLVVAFFGSAVFNLLRRQFTPSVGVWISRPEPTFFGFWAGAALLVALMTWAFRRGATPWGLSAGCWLWWAAAAAVVSTMYPGFGYLFLVPTAAAALALAAAVVFTGRSTLVFSIPALIALLVWLPQAWYLKDFIGLGNMPPVALIVAFALTACGPLFAPIERPGRATAGLAAVTVALLGIGTRVAVFSEESPQWANVIYSLDADSGRARWFYTGFPLPDAVVAAGGFGEEFGRPLPWTPGDGGAVADALPTDLAPPEFVVLEQWAAGDSVTIRARVRSPRGAPVVQVAFGSGAVPTRVTFGGEEVPEDEASFPLFDGDFAVYTIWTVPDSGAVAEFTVPAGARFDFLIADRSYDLPDVALPLQAARPATAAPIGAGDATVVQRRVAVR